MTATREQLTQTIRDLTILRDHLLKVDEENWIFSFWQKDQDEQPKPDCGFVGCAGGHACQIQEFKDRGLHLGNIRSGNGHFTDIFPLFENNYGCMALAEFFGISFAASSRIFTMDGYTMVANSSCDVTIRMVVDNIDEEIEYCTKRLRTALPRLLCPHKRYKRR